jgi:hypothetical protein
MSDLSTFAGQAEHYAAVKARLWGNTPVPRARRISPPVSNVIAEAPKEPAKPESRDFLFVTLPADPEAPERDILMPVWKVIVHEVAKKHGVGFMEIVGAQRSRRIVAARHECCYRIAMETTMSLPMIGRRLGGRDHTTILHGLRMHAQREGVESSRTKAKREPVWTKEGWK